MVEYNGHHFDATILGEYKFSKTKTKLVESDVYEMKIVKQAKEQ